MQVFFDGQVFSFQKYGGISRIFFELMQSFAQTQRIEQILYKGIYIDRYPFKKEWFKRYYGFRRPTTRGMRFTIPIDNFIRPLHDVAVELAYTANASSDLIYHSTYYRTPKRHRGPVVVHAYDMIHELYNGDSKTILTKKKAFKAADLIIAISQSTKKDLCRLYSIDPSMIVVAYPGISKVFRSWNSDRMRNAKAERNDGRPYMLYVGSRGWYKNFDLLLKVFIDCGYFHDFDLILVGGGRALSIQQQEAVSRTGKENWLKHKFCDDIELASLYGNAATFICTSQYEGFGIPLVEAMACGCPVVAPNTSSIPEVVGDAALLFDPENPEDLKRQIDRTINDRALSMSLIEKGRLRAQRFSWEAMADAVYEGYTRVI